MRATVPVVADPQQPFVLVLPRFSRWMKILSIYVGVAWGVEVLLGMVAPGFAARVLSYLALVAADLVPGLQLWRAVTYVAVMDPGSIGNALWTVAAFWWLGSPVEQARGPRTVLEVAVAGTVGGALAVLLASRVVPMVRVEPVLGMDCIASGLLAAWGFVHADQQVSFFGTGRMKGAHLALALAGLNVVMALYARHATGFASVGGLAGGAAWMWLASRRTRGGGRAQGKRTSGVGASKLRSIRGGRDDRTMWN